MAGKGLGLWLSKSRNLGLLLSVVLVIVSFVGWGGGLDKRITLLEDSKTHDTKTIEKIDVKLGKLDEKLNILISQFQFERGKRDDDK